MEHHTLTMQIALSPKQSEGHKNRKLAQSKQAANCWAKWSHSASKNPGAKACSWPPRSVGVKSKQPYTLHPTPWP